MLVALWPGVPIQSSRSKNEAPLSFSIFRVKLVYQFWNAESGIGVSGLPGRGQLESTVR